MDRTKFFINPSLFVASIFTVATLYSAQTLATDRRAVTTASTDCADSDRRCKRRKKRPRSGSESGSETRREERRQKRAERETKREGEEARKRATRERAERERREKAERRAERERTERERRERTERRTERERTERERRERTERRAERERRERTERRAERERRERTERRTERERVRREQNRRRVERERERREQARRSERVRNRERKQRRREARNRYRDHSHHYRYNPRVIRRHRRWHSRYSTWHNRHHRYAHPGWPARRITYPAVWPRTDLWRFSNIIDVSDNIESTFSHLYNHIFDNRWESGLARKAYEGWHAAQVYSDAVEFYRSKMYFSVYELFHLEEKAEALHEELSRYSGYHHAKRHLNVARYYINELLWQYRRQMGPINQWRDLINEGDDWRYGAGSEWEEIEESTTSNSETFAFWWEKPHRNLHWDIGRNNNLIDTLLIEATNTRGKKGKNGVSGITHVILNFTDGSEIDLVNTNHDKFSPRTGQLVLDFEGDDLELSNPYPHLRVSSIEIVADSWVAPEIDVELQVTIFSKN